MDNEGGRRPGDDDERWTALFADVEGELAAADARELADEVAERTRAEWAAASMDERLAGSTGRSLRIGLPGSLTASGQLADAGTGWLELTADDAARWLVVSAAALWVSGTGEATPPVSGAVVRSLPAALRRIVRERAPVRLLLRDGSGLAGTLEQVLADAVVLAQHEPGIAPRADAVRQRLLVPLSALAAVRYEPAV